MQNESFENAGISLDNGIAAAQTVFSQLKTNRADNSYHYEIFAAIGLVHDVKSILEIGTSKGHFTQFLSHLFPNAQIQTWDLSEESFTNPRASAYKVIAGTYGSQTSESNNRLMRLSNVSQVRADSTRLAFSEDQFDLIWVDGDHTFPVAAFDIINALRLVKHDGWICVDDIRFQNTGSNRLGTDETFRTVQHLNESGLVTVHYISKRLTEYDALLDRTYRKHVAILRKVTSV